MGALCVYFTNLQSQVTHTVPLKSLGLLFLMETLMSLSCVENIANIHINLSPNQVLSLAFYGSQAFLSKVYQAVNAAKGGFLFKGII